MGAAAKRTVTIKGKPFTLAGTEVAVGQKAPDFMLIAPDFSEVRLSDSRGKARLLSVVHSLDTGICDLQTRKFEAEAARFPNVVVYTISMDLPFAQARYCGANSIKNIRTLSDYRDASFGKAYGLLIEELRLLCRAVIVIGPDDVVRYVECLPEVAQHPNYNKALKALAVAWEQSAVNSDSKPSYGIPKEDMNRDAPPSFPVGGRTEDMALG